MITGLYTVLGGLRAVMITETIQSVLLIGTRSPSPLRHPGPAGAGVHSLAEFKAALKPDQLSMLLPAAQRRPGLAAVRARFSRVGHLVLVYRSDHRAAGARRRLENDAQNGALFAGLLKVLPVFILVFPGVCG